MAKRIEKLALACAQCAQALGEELGAMDYLESENKKTVSFFLELRLSCVEIVLTKKNSVMCPVGTLFARVYPQKNRPLSLHLYELMDEDDFRCCYFPYNHSPEQLQLSFAVLADLLRELLPRAETMALDNALYERRVTEKCAAIAACAGEDVAPLREYLTEEEIQMWLFAQWGEFYETFAQLLPFTQNDAYAAFVAGDIDKALKKYRKQAEKGKLEPYFQRLYAFLQTEQARTFAPLPEDCGAVYLQGREQQYGVKEGGRLLAVMGVLYAVFLPLFYLIAGGFYAAFCRGAAYAPFDGVFVAILPLLPALFGALSLRRRLFPLLFRKDAERWMAQDELENSTATNTVCHVLFGLATVVCLLFSVVFTLAAPRFYADRMVWDDADKFPLLNPVTYIYEDVEQVYYIEGRINTFGDLVERGSYVLVFEDGSAIDLDGSLSVKQSEQHVLPLIAPYIDEIITCSTDVELAKQYDKSVDDFFGYNDVTW